jgi:hypothetical protein
MSQYSESLCLILPLYHKQLLTYDNQPAAYCKLIERNKLCCLIDDNIERLSLQSSVCFHSISTLLQTRDGNIRCRAVQRSIQPTDRASLWRNTSRQSCTPTQIADSGAMNSSNLCTATRFPEGCHAIIRSAARLAQRHPRPAPGRG